MSVSNHRIHLITGEDDVVVGAGGLEAFERNRAWIFLKEQHALMYLKKLNQSLVIYSLGVEVLRALFVNETRGK